MAFLESAMFFSNYVQLVAFCLIIGKQHFSAHKMIKDMFVQL